MKIGVRTHCSPGVGQMAANARNAASAAFASFAGKLNSRAIAVVAKPKSESGLSLCSMAAGLQRTRSWSMLKLWMIEIVLCIPNVRFVQSMNFLLRGLVEMSARSRITLYKSG